MCFHHAKAVIRGVAPLPRELACGCLYQPVRLTYSKAVIGSVIRELACCLALAYSPLIPMPWLRLGVDSPSLHLVMPTYSMGLSYSNRSANLSSSYLYILPSHLSLSCLACQASKAAHVIMMPHFKVGPRVLTSLSLTGWPCLDACLKA